MTRLSRRLFFLLLLATLLLSPALAFGWGAGMHATLTAHGHERMTARWKDALDRSLLIYGSFGPDVWYIQKVGEEAELVCPVACGPDDGRISNECWGRYDIDPDRYFAYARQLLVNADSLPAVSWAFGYAAHAVEDWRGHMEYIIPDWVNPGSGMKNRHTLVDASGAALAFNYKGLHGYPSHITMDRNIYGYMDGGFVNAANAQAHGERNPLWGLALDIRSSSSGRRIFWSGILDEATHHLGAETLGYMADFASLGSASEGILASVYGLTHRYDSIGADWPIVVEDGQVAINCGTNYRQRLISEQGVGHPFACQIYNASLLSGVIYGALKPAIWFNYLKPADDGSDQIVVDDAMVELWMDRFANHFEWDGVRLDDQAVFGINPETGLSEKNLRGVDGRNFTYGRSLAEIVGEVLELSVQDVLEQVMEQPAFVGAVLQSRLNPVDKARFVAFGFAYRPRLSAWPETLAYQEQTITLHPQAPGPFAQLQIPVDISTPDSNAAPDMVFPYYLVTLQVESETAFGTGRLRGVVQYRDADNSVLDSPLGSFEVDTDGEAFENPSEIAALATHDAEGVEIRVLLDNRTGGWYFHNPESQRAALTLDLELGVTDPSRPPFDFIVNAVIQPYCSRPDLNAPGAPASDNSACPLEVPEFPEPDGDGDHDQEEDAEVPDDTEEPVVDGDDTEEPVADGDTGAQPGSGGGGCRSLATTASTGLFILLIGLALTRRRIRA